MTRAQQAARTRQTILDTAQQLFATEGYDATSLQTIADTMGVTKANVYYYFHTKQQLLEAILDCSLQPIRELLDAAEQIADRRERIRFLVDGYVAEVVSRRAAIQNANSDPALHRQKRLSQAIDEVVRRGMSLTFGDDPAPEDRLSYLLMLGTAQVVPQLADLDDDELRATLRTVYLRLHRYEL